jgi:hypothetical protein
VLFQPVYIQGGFHFPLLTTQFAFSAIFLRNRVFYAYFTKQYLAFDDPWVAQKCCPALGPHVSGPIYDENSRIDSTIYQIQDRGAVLYSTVLYI